ncbi:MAG TPA: hypothetical protein VGJ72_19165 [Polaromonas sp.]
MHIGVKQASGSGANLMAFDHHARRAVLHDFVTALRTNSESAVTARSALQVRRLIAAMIESSNSEVAVSILP